MTVRVDQSPISMEQVATPNELEQMVSLILNTFHLTGLVVSNQDMIH